MKIWAYGVTGMLTIIGFLLGVAFVKNWAYYVSGITCTLFMIGFLLGRHQAKPVEESKMSMIQKAESVFWGIVYLLMIFSIVALL
ncbi:MAG: hypothetical protein A3F84_12835 [Candidatus Handelsmanbacteria bacterium RIFCSPLOWO2_12_FULL_64_10]|uniref:Uncharacterized protein n=1 Tax=Handelsmanbacteria sp. (strain RIFCSPLOWO2_12_FULL_64_10) TaxID=1817868 RepID=A0A1F6CFZ7_HANXR|nr:MAG: hypothetical protein A3F84_12835 [Candidatus Handelsmanbacteria bacterium RIFCSPLOWO2_12_FULL_64_10]